MVQGLSSGQGFIIQSLKINLQRKMFNSAEITFHPFLTPLGHLIEGTVL